MTEETVDSSPGLVARLAGALWLLTFLTASFGLFTSAGMVARDDAPATAANILAGESLYRAASLANIVAGLCYLGVTALLYRLLAPVSRGLSLLAAFFGLGGVAIGGLLYLLQLAPLVILHGGEHPGAITSVQLEEMALLTIRLGGNAFTICMFFFGIQCLIAGCLIFRSDFLPSLPGGLLMIGGGIYLIVCAARVLSPAWGASLSPLIFPAGLMGEGSVTLWLLFKGVNMDRWAGRAHGIPDPAA